MKKAICLILILSILCCPLLASALEYTALYVGSGNAFVNDIKTPIDPDNENVKVFVENDRSYVPVRFLAETYGGNVEWNGETQTVTISFPEREISLTIGTPEIIIGGISHPIDVAPVIRENRTFLPLRACTEAIGKEVFYSKGLILVSDIPNILDETWDSEIVDILIEYFE